MIHLKMVVAQTKRSREVVRVSLPFEGEMGAHFISIYTKSEMGVLNKSVKII